VIESLQNAWHGLLDLISGIVIPDWGALVNLLPVFLLFGVIMPILTIVVLAWVAYVLRKPRARVQVAEGPQAAAIGSNGSPIYPTGEPFCTRDRLVYAPGVAACEVCHQALSVTCPKCGVGRSAAITTCGNCGLILTMAPRVRARSVARPKPGAAAAA